ncbi:hypothetical protein [Methanosphaera sp. WGK6]|uniref:hypothetical protein n=1 Tax=Methanosphaera sp. WGK6 TaxID=1561964 RepID=UPI00084CC21B|nr:hypothetical protein [Methanosphaera sp. WGK6]OED30032.1 hypothetical protein NL43_04740 [Methanosphaera sp. WGK6]
MSNKRTLMFLMALVVLILGLSAVNATDISDINSTTVSNSQITQTETVIDDSSNIETIDVTKETSTNNINKNKISCNDNNKLSTKTAATLKTDSQVQTHIITNTTFNNYFTSSYLNNNVNAGDTLDFRGNFFSSSENNYTMVINKPVNIIASLNNSNISLNTTSSDFFGDSPGDSFVISKAGSGTNVTGLYFYNTQIFVKNANNVTLRNLTILDIKQVVGGGVGVCSIRENSSYITVQNCYFYTENNGGHSSLVGAWAHHCTFDNNTIVGSGNLGNLLYLTTYNVDIPDLRSTNDYNNITNNKIYGPSSPLAICYGICIVGSNNIIENNTIEYNRGQGIIAQYGSGTGTEGDGTNQIITQNNIIRNNVLLNGSSMSAPVKSIVYNNTVTGTTMINYGTTYYNNTLNTVETRAGDSLGTISVYNNTMNNLTIRRSAQATNITFSNNTINGNIIIQPASTGYYNENVTIVNNTIRGNISTGSETTGNIGNISIKSNNITGILTLASKRNVKINGMTITNNTIISPLNYTITLTSNTANILVQDNLLTSNESVGNITVIDKGSNNIIIDNGPSPEVITDYTRVLIAPVNGMIGSVVTIDATITYGKTIVNGGKVVFKINGKSIRDNDGNIIQVDVTGGKAALNIIVPVSWSKQGTIISAVYGGYNEFNHARSQNYTLNITKRTTSLEFKSITAKIGETITFSVKITDNSTISTGKVVFKINGKTIRDTTGNPIYVQVVNGVATLKYTIPTTMTVKNYTIQCVYGNNIYNRAENSTILSVTK